MGPTLTAQQRAKVSQPAEHSLLKQCSFKHKGLKNKTKFESFESSYIYFGKPSVDDELMSLTAWGMKLLCSLVVRRQILLYLLSDGSRVNRLWHVGVVFQYLTSLMSLMLCRWWQQCSGGFNQPLKSLFVLGHV